MHPRMTSFMSAETRGGPLSHFVRSENIPVRKLIVFHKEFNPLFYYGHEYAGTRAATEFILYNMADRAIKHWRG